MVPLEASGLFIFVAMFLSFLCFFQCFLHPGRSAEPVCYRRRRRDKVGQWLRIQPLLNLRSHAGRVPGHAPGRASPRL